MMTLVQSRRRPDVGQSGAEDPQRQKDGGGLVMELWSYGVMEVVHSGEIFVVSTRGRRYLKQISSVNIVKFINNS